MSETPFGPAGGVPVYACALIGDPQGEGMVLLVRHGQGWALPGAWVRSGERVEDAMRRGVRDATGAEVSDADLLTVAEDPAGLVFVFNVTDEPFPHADQPHLVWRPSDGLQDLWPEGLQGELDEDPPTWLPRPRTQPGAPEPT